jgi:hypothetical protein
VKSLIACTVVSVLVGLIGNRIDKESSFLQYALPFAAGWVAMDILRYWSNR